MTHKLENNYIADVLPQGWKFWAPHQAPYPGVWHREEKPPEHLALKASGVWLQEFHRTGGKRNSTLGGHTQGLVHTSAQGKKQWPHRSLGQTYLLVLKSLLGRQGLWITAGTKTLVAVVLGSTHWHESSWRLPFSHQDLVPPNSLQAPVLALLRPNNQQGSNTAPPIRRQAA